MVVVMEYGYDELNSRNALSKPKYTMAGIMNYPQSPKSQDIDKKTLDPTHLGAQPTPA